MENEEGSETRRQEESAAKKQRRIKQHCSAQSIEVISQVFITATKEGSDYICTCCHRLMYQKTVIEFNISKYPKAPEEFVSMSVRTSAKDKVWVCKTYDYTLRRRGRMPAQAKANKLDLEAIPTELPDLTPLEERLICLRIPPFMKMVALPCGKQRAIQCTHRPDTCVYPSPKTAIPSSDGAHEAKEEAVTKVTICTSMYTLQKRPC